MAYTQHKIIRQNGHNIKGKTHKVRLSKSNLHYCHQGKEILAEPVNVGVKLQ
jgi:hypothetical protein